MKTPKINMPNWVKEAIKQIKKNNIKKQKPIYCNDHPDIMLTKNEVGNYYCRKCKKWTKI